MDFSPLTHKLIEALRCLPGVGPKTAQRMAFHLLDRERENGKYLAQTINQAMQQVGYCQTCRTFSETDTCRLCTNPARDSSILCIVETPADIVAIEQTAAYQGRYFVLMGHLSPLDGIGPNELGMEQLQCHLQNNQIKEIIIATNHTAEGEATAYYIAESAKPFNIKISRIAYGVPLGGELEYVDSRTIAGALQNRTSYENERNSD
ncbi:MAG: recombination mediator RecR [Gammaproteobacteria bacterium]|jgi:recombination protein RecR